MKKYLLLLFVAASLLITLIPKPAYAHQILNTIVILNVHNDNVTAQVKLPVSELGLAMNTDFTTNPDASFKANETKIKDYLMSHTRPTTDDKKAWKVSIDNLSLENLSVDAVGTYTIVKANMTMTPPVEASTKKFIFDYDGIVNEVDTHVVFVSVNEDWSNGLVSDNAQKQVGVIQLDTVHNNIAPMSVDLSGSDLWRGFGGMVKLGMDHIRGGTDHLLFLFTLLLPAPLLVVAHRWKKFGGSKKSLWNILKIATAFTIGHSITLIVSTLIHLNIPAWPIEAMIAVSIMVSALHSFRPIFAGKEIFIAGGFGLIHGMSFSFILSKLALDPAQLVVSLLGFNVGIELMQLLIIAITMPSLIILATTRLYSPIRVGGAAVAFVAATGWLFERIGHPNYVSAVANSLSVYAVWIIVGLAVAAAAVLLVRRLTLTPAAVVVED